MCYMLSIAQRKTGETFLNEKSSRSHQILRLVRPLLVYIHQFHSSMLLPDINVYYFRLSKVLLRSS
jgi:hypothetical protein